MAHAIRPQSLRLESRPGRMPAIDAAGFLVGVALLVAARFVPQFISPLAFWLLVAALACAFGIDLLLWFARGVHAMELDGDTLTLRRGWSRTVQRIERASVRRVRSRRTWGGRTIEIRLLPRADRGSRRSYENVIDRVLSLALRRNRVLLRDDAFDRAAFASLAGLLAGWNRRAG